MSDKNFNENMGSKDSLSKERLLDILQAEFESEGTDVELIKRVNKALDEKEGTENANVDAAWEHFLKLSAESEPIYDIEEDEIVKISKVGTKKRKSHRKAFIAVAAAIIILAGGTVAANANGIDLWGAVVSWTAETFGFSKNNNVSSTSREIPVQLEELATYFDQYGISRDKLPTYIPEGYEHRETKVAESSASTLLVCSLNNENSEIVLRYVFHFDEKIETQMQKDDLQPEIYTLNGIDFYFVANNDHTYVTWVDGNFECQIVGLNSPDDAVKMIDSIYKDG